MRYSILFSERGRKTTNLCRGTVDSRIHSLDFNRQGPQGVPLGIASHRTLRILHRKHVRLGRGRRVRVVRPGVWWEIGKPVPASVYVPAISEFRLSGLGIRIAKLSVYVMLDCLVEWEDGEARIVVTDTTSTPRL